MLYMSFSWMIDQGILKHNQFILLQLVPLLLFLHLFSVRRVNVTFKPKSITVFFSLIVVFSSLYNAVYVVPMLLNIRWLILPFFVYLVLINMKLKEEELKGLVRFVFIMGLVQIPLGIIKYFILNWHGETTLGLISHSGSTYLVSIAFAFIIAYAPSNSLMKNVLLFVGFVMVAVSSAKRAVVILLPFIFIMFMYINRDNAKRNFRMFIYALLLLPFFIYALVRLSPTLNPDHKVWGRFDMDYTLSYVMEYEDVNRKTGNYATANRTGTTMLILNESLSNPFNFLLGFGGDKLSKSMKDVGSLRDLNKKVEYGYNGFTWLLYQFGIIASVIWFMFFYKFKNIAMKIIKKTKSSFWKAYAKGIYATAIFMSVFQFVYSAEYKNTELISLVYILFAVTLIYNKKYANNH